MKIENEENKKNDSTEEEKINEEEKRKQRLFEIEKKLGRHNNDKAVKNKRNNNCSITIYIEINRRKR